MRIIQWYQTRFSVVTCWWDSLYTISYEVSCRNYLNGNEIAPPWHGVLHDSFLHIANDTPPYPPPPTPQTLSMSVEPCSGQRSHMLPLILGIMASACLSTAALAFVILKHHNMHATLRQRECCAELWASDALTWWLSVENYIVFFSIYISIFRYMDNISPFTLMEPDLIFVYLKIFKYRN